MSGAATDGRAACICIAYRSSDHGRTTRRSPRALHSRSKPSDLRREILIEIASFAFARRTANVFGTAAARPMHRSTH
ncbi:hypothetical protein WI97_25775 [Burkholderia vietnamiensis]|nr:hypothetical protein WI97_25775 [Burkholderia vietnamiensis]